MALTRPFAENGDKLPIPTDASSDGSVSYDQGFGDSYALPPEEGGKFINRAQFNQLMYDTTSQVLTNKTNITTIQGDVATAKANITTLQRDVNNLEGDVASIENTISQVVSSNVTPIGAYKTVENKTIGTNGDFKTIKEALAYVQTHQKQSPNQNLRLTLLENLNNEILFFRGAWYPYLTIDCNGFTLADKLTIDLSCFLIHQLKLNDRLVCANSILWLTGNIDINFQSNDYPGGCVTGLAGAFIQVSGDTFNFSTTSNKSAFHSKGNGMIYLANNTAITQTTGANCFSVSNGGIIQLNAGLNLTGVTVPKASQAANTITNAGLIIGKYYSI